MDRQRVVQFYEDLLERHGDSHLGVGWTKDPRNTALRYKMMLEMIRPHENETIELLDFGCGLSHFYDYITSKGISNIRYSGLDITPKSLAISRSKHPDVQYYDADIMDPLAVIPEFDYIVANGVFTAKVAIDSYAAMLEFWETLLIRLFRFARVGLAFNVTTKYVDWEREDLFHLPLDTMASFVTRSLSRNFVIRHDYGLYEYTVFVYRQPLALE